MKVRNTPKVSIQYLNIERDKWVKFVLWSKPNLPRYSSLSGGSRLPQHWCLPWLCCGGTQGGCCFAFLLLTGEAAGENPPGGWTWLLCLSPQPTLGIQEVLESSSLTCCPVQTGSFPEIWKLPQVLRGFGLCAEGTALLSWEEGLQCSRLVVSSKRFIQMRMESPIGNSGGATVPTMLPICSELSKALEHRLGTQNPSSRAELYNFFAQEKSFC